MTHGRADITYHGAVSRYGALTELPRFRVPVTGVRRSYSIRPSPFFVSTLTLTE